MVGLFRVLVCHPTVCVFVPFLFRHKYLQAPQEGQLEGGGGRRRVYSESNQGGRRDASLLSCTPGRIESWKKKGPVIALLHARKPNDYSSLTSILWSGVASIKRVGLCIYIIHSSLG